MQTASIEDLQVHTEELLRQVAEGSVIRIERDGEPVAELRPAPVRKQLTQEAYERIEAEMKEFRARMPKQVSDSTLILEELRNP